MTKPDHPEPGPAVGRSTAAILRDRNFGPFFVGTAVIASGMMFHNVAAAVLVFRLTESAVAVGAVSVMLFAPLVATPWAGVLSDRVDRRRVILAGLALCLAGSGALAVWSGIAGVDGLPGAWPVLATAFLLGCGFSVLGPAVQALLPTLVPREDLTVAVSVHTITFNFGRAVGPALGAVTLATLGPSACFAISTLSVVISMALFGAVRQPMSQEPEQADRSVGAGFRYVRSQPRVMTCLIGVAAIGVTTDPVITLTPPLAEKLGGGDELVGILASTFGAGAVVVLAAFRLLSERVGLERVSVGGLFLVATSMALAGWSPVPLAAAGLLFLAGAGMLFALAGLTTLIQEEIPDYLRGRVMALWGVAYVGTRPLAAMINGAVADWQSTGAAFTLAGFLALVAGMYVGRLRR